MGGDALLNPRYAAGSVRGRLYTVQP